MGTLYLKGLDRLRFENRLFRWIYASVRGSVNCLLTPKVKAWGASMLEADIGSKILEVDGLAMLSRLSYMEGSLKMGVNFEVAVRQALCSECLLDPIKLDNSVVTKIVEAISKSSNNMELIADLCNHVLERKAKFLARLCNGLQLAHSTLDGSVDIPYAVVVLQKFLIAPYEDHRRDMTVN